jgi:hypothetical protein
MVATATIVALPARKIAGYAGPTCPVKDFPT